MTSDFTVVWKSKMIISRRKRRSTGKEMMSECEDCVRDSVSSLESFSIIISNERAGKTDTPKIDEFINVS